MVSKSLARDQRVRTHSRVTQNGLDAIEVILKPGLTMGGVGVHACKFPTVNAARIGLQSVTKCACSDCLEATT